MSGSERWEGMTKSEAVVQFEVAISQGHTLAPFRNNDKVTILIFTHNDYKSFNYTEHPVSTAHLRTLNTK